MALVSRYTPEIIRKYEDAGFWTPEYPVDFWRRQASERPGREALVASDGRYTWAQAIKVVDRIAAGLLADGWRRNDMLILQAQNSAELVLLRLACEAAGVIAVLIPITFSRAEINSIREQLPVRGAAVPASARGTELLTHYRGVEFLYTVGKPPLSSTMAVPQHSAPHHLVQTWRGFGPYEYGAVVTTSGTTATPRCVEHTACARLAAGRQYIDRLHLTGEDVICGFTSIFSGNCDLLLFHAAPQVGAKVVLLDVFSPESACELIERERVTGAVFVPTLLHRLLSYPRLNEHDVSSLRFITSFGAMLAPNIAEEAETRLGVRVIQGYGASEYGALASTSYDDPAIVRLRGVGRPLPGTEIEFRDESGNRLPTGAVGRIYARGPHCVGGFVNDAEATANAWSGGFIAMGDLGRLDQDGYLWLEGRARDVIIRGGQNISPLEIEDALLRHPDVREVAAVRMPDAEMGERVCVYVVPGSGATPSLVGLCEFLLERGFARFKLPERLELISAMPMNPAGTKINKKALEALLIANIGSNQLITEGGAI